MGFWGILLIILASLVLIVLILLIIPLGVVVNYDGLSAQTAVKIKVWLFSFTLDTDKPKKKKLKKPKKKVEKKQEDTKPPESQLKRFKRLYKKYRREIQQLPTLIYKIIASIKIYNIVIVHYVHSEDAADTAISVGRNYALFSGAVAAVSPPFNLTFKQVEFVPDFAGVFKDRAKVSLTATTSILKLIIVAVWFYKRVRKKPQRKTIQHTKKQTEKR